MKTNWQIKKLGEVCDIGAGNSAPQNKESFNGGKYPFFRTSDVGRIRFGVIADSTNKLNEIGIKKLHLYKKGTLLLPKSGASTFLNHRVLMTTDGYVSSHLATLKAKDNILDDRFLLYFSSTIDSRNLMQDQNYPSLRLSDIQEINILLPSFYEQQRIVAILDEAFSAIAKAKENAEKNLQNASELFESYLQSVFANPGDGWEEKKLGEVCEKITKGSSPNWQGIKYVDMPGVLFVTSENVGNRSMLFPKMKYVEDKFNISDRKSILKVGDVLTNIVGASIGRTAIFDLDGNANINQAVCLLRVKVNLLYNRFLMNLLSSPYFKNHLHENEINNARANLSLGFFTNLVIPLPPLPEQKRIVANLNALSAETKKLEALYRQKLSDLDELKKTVLQKAFNGDI